MKRSISAIALCSSLLLLLVLFLFPPSSVTAAKENVLLKLLSLPAPPPPNLLSRADSRYRDEKFYDKNNPPKDDAPIEDLIDYWTHQAGEYRSPFYPRQQSPSDRVVERLAAEMANKPELAGQLLSALPDNKTASDTIKEVYDRLGTEEGTDRNERRELRNWLRMHSSYFSADLERVSEQIKDTSNGYVSIGDENTLLALTTHDFDKASPILNQLYNDNSQPVSKVLAAWALYRHALETNSLGDIERYRSELMHIVEDRSQTEGVRDKANDALTHEAHFPGLDDWTFSLFEDESLVKITQYTMLTTMVMYAPVDKFGPRLISLIEKSSSPAVRTAAIRNLVVVLSRDPSPELERQILETMLPWLEDPKWADDSANARGLLVRKLSQYQIPESVPGLIKVLDEKQTRTSPGLDLDFSDGLPSNVMMRPVNVAPATNMSRMPANSLKKSGLPETFYPYRNEAITALAKQKDVRAAPALRRVLSEVEGYQRNTIVGALLACGGFSIPEEMDALESAAKKNRDVLNGADANVVYRDYYGPMANTIKGSAQPRPITHAEINMLLGQQILQSSEIGDLFARAIVDRIEVIDENDPPLAAAFRAIILKWQNSVFNVLLLHDLKRDAADTDTIIRLLSQRKDLREKQAPDVFDLQAGKPVAVGIAACLLDDPAGYDALLETGDDESKTAMLACARLIRAPLPITKVAENLKTKSQMLQTAAERYLEAEDSIEARSIILGRHPNEAKILGATTAFFVDGGEESSQFLWMLYQSLGNNSLYNGWGEGSGNDDELKAGEKRLQEEVKKDDDLIGIYAYDSNYIRIYKDRVIFSWDEDDSRYRERALTKEEFEEIKSYLTTNKVDELAPFLSCGGGYCGAMELVMLGRGGGRRVYMNSGFYQGARASSNSEFFTGLDKYFADLKLTRAVLKYNLSRDIPGLEILLASDDLHAETVWKNGDDLRVAATDVQVRKKVKAEMDNAAEDVGPKEEEADDEEKSDVDRKALLASIDKHRYDGYAWYKVANGETAGVAAQPPQVEFVPLRDALAVQPSDEQWKARAGDVEIRTSEEGIFKVIRGKLTKLQKGYYQHAVIMPSGRWVLASKSDPEGGEGVVRIDMLTGREYPVEIPGYGQTFPVSYVSTLNKFLVVRNDRYEYEGEYYQEDDDAAPFDADPGGMMLVDPVSGAVQPIAGEFRPLGQQTFRALQQSSKANEYWAAIHDPEKNETQVGIYDIKLFGFRTVLRIPKINFNSMSMWVDEAGGKVYFVYRGHLLALPMSQSPQR